MNPKRFEGQAIFFPQHLGRVQFNKIQRAFKEQSKNRKTDEETSVSRKFYTHKSSHIRTSAYASYDCVSFLHSS
ncbi:hypothetical protein [Streptococcus huangxiaojuni]|uniref:hypothetical protein n=1 Tax=Streptococcus huangxiaojuni TaxID=3237239 RepID=UPI0034A138A7